MGLAGIVNKNVDRTAGFSNFVEEAGGRSLLTEISDEGPAVNAVGRELVSCLLPVSYTHLDVYKRQRQWLLCRDPEDREHR